MIIDLEVFERKGNKKYKIMMLELLGFELTPEMKQKIMYEDFLTKAYKDSIGKWTIGVGNTRYMLGGRFVEEGDVISIVEGINELRVDYEEAKENLWYNLGFSDYELNFMGEKRRNVLIDLIFNMGLNGVKKFPSMIHSLKEGNWEKASKELKYADGKSVLSNYYKQVGQRAKDNVRKLKEG